MRPYWKKQPLNGVLILHYLYTTYGTTIVSILFQLCIYKKKCVQIKRQWQCKTNLLINGDRVRHRYFLGDGDSLEMFMVMIQSMPAIPQRWRDAHKQTHPHCHVHAHPTWWNGCSELHGQVYVPRQLGRTSPCVCVRIA